MKIKTRKMSYEQVSALPRGKHRKPLHPNFLLQTVVRVAAIFEDLEDGRIRVSLRSKDPGISVAAIAEQFGGGGHAMASGIRMRGGLEHCHEQVLEAIRKEFAV